MGGNDREWMTNRTTQMSFLIGVILQTIALVWYVSSLDNNVQNNTRDIVRHELRIKNLETLVQNQALISARIDENIKSIRKSVEKMAND
jgi:hypothetical protein|tara:strand:- start:780 stop:1046 length:267 start_codon:yes stop_codon:yes gene_type:complete